MARPVLDKRTNWQIFKDFFLKTYDETEKFAEEDIDKSALFAPIAYLGILFFVPLLIRPKSAFAKYHANQGLVLLLTTITAYAVIFLTGLLFNLVGLWIFTMCLFFVYNLFMIALIIIGAYNASSGYAKELPLVGRFRIIKAL
ncbi:MAG: hypothetical protein IKB92_07440 [Clostridia bacterium]|nr:hypothetical protein [Clostridia bacterium]